jgi:hypothetical protein
VGISWVVCANVSFSRMTQLTHEMTTDRTVGLCPSFNERGQFFQIVVYQQFSFLDFADIDRKLRHSKLNSDQNIPNLIRIHFFVTGGRVSRPTVWETMKYLLPWSRLSLSFYSGLFYNAVISWTTGIEWDCYKINDGLEGSGLGLFVTEENHKNPRSTSLVPWPKIEPSCYRILV